MDAQKITITFLGATGMVTGSKTLVETDTLRLLVDYGAFQEETLDTARLNRALPKDPSSIDYVILTHGHLDHCGMLPYLVKNGFQGPVYGTAPTLDIARIIMADSARIQEFEAKKAQKREEKKHRPKKYRDDKKAGKGIKKHRFAEDEKARPVKPYFYGQQDVADTYSHLVDVEPDTWIELQDGSRIRFRYNSHILGSTFVELETAGKTLVFSGDIGRSDDRLMYEPQKPDKADVVIIEGTYGDKNHPEGNAEEDVLRIAEQCWESRGTMLIPSFAVERTQVMMDILYSLREKGKLPPMPVYVDSPMGISVLGLFNQYPTWHKLTKARNNAMSGEFMLVEDSKISRRIVEDDEPKIVIAGSGMLTGGRILNYLKKYIRFTNTHILIVGYQGEETPGRALLEGKDVVVIDNKTFKVNAHIHHLNYLSAHADQNGLLDWLGGIRNKPEMVLINHSDPVVAPVFAEEIKKRFGWNAEVPVIKKPNHFY